MLPLEKTFEFNKPHEERWGFLKATASRAILHPRLQGNFQKLLRCHRAEKLQPGYTVRRQTLRKERLPQYQDFSVALPAQDMLHTEICTCGSI